jgi:glutaminyl-tRNA synthetase
MSEAEARPTNFIRQIIDEDLASGKHASVVTRICTLATQNRSA